MATLCSLLLVTVHLGCIADPVFIEGRIFRVVDGDTVTLKDDHGEIHKTRLAGIDAQESRMSFGQEASAFLSDLVLGKHVKVLAYKKDRYGRTIATLLLQGKDVNLGMIQPGLDWPYKQYPKEQPAEEEPTCASAEASARSQRLALWSEPSPATPWEWRAQRRSKTPADSATIMHLVTYRIASKSQ